jgi:rhodanese-related sulfurtransferase
MFERLMGLETVSPNELHHMVQADQVVVIDVNSRLSWMTAHVPSARNLGPSDFTANDLPPDTQSTLVFYCSNPFCRKAPSAARRAKKMGYRNAKVMSAGISGWLAAELPTATGRRDYVRDVP